jgi:sugar phosphate isomerase/epimerase
MTRGRIRVILDRHYGAKAQIAHELGINRVSVYCWIWGRTESARVHRAANARALELLAEEAEQKQEKGSPKQLQQATL